MTEIKGALTSVADIWLDPTLVDIDCGAREEICGGCKGLFAQDRRLLQIFGWGSCRFGIFGSGSMSVEEVHDPDWIPGVGMTYGRLWLHRYPVDGKDK